MWPACLTGSRRVYGHIYDKRAAAGDRTRSGEPLCTSETRLRPPYDVARAT